MGRWLASLPRRPRVLLEPFAGAAHVGLSAAFAGWMEQVVLVEIDPDVASLWQAALSSASNRMLCRLIADFSPTPAEVARVAASNFLDLEMRAFRTLVINRCHHGGKLFGSSPLRSGEDGRGISSRWYPATLISRLCAILAFRDRIRFTEGDGLEAIRRWRDASDVAMFLDPPYVCAGCSIGRRLYAHAATGIDAALSAAAGGAAPYLLCFADVPHAHYLALSHGLTVSEVPMQDTAGRKRTEILITAPRSPHSARSLIASSEAVA